MNEIEIRRIILEELASILMDSVNQIDTRLLLDTADSASRRTISHLVGAVNNRLDDLDKIEENK